jgi:hypothetical protein
VSTSPHVDGGARLALGSVQLRLIGLFLLTDAATVAFVAGWEPPIRVALVLTFLLFVPGLALTDALEIRDPVQQLALGPPASLALETLVSVALLYAGSFSAERAFAIVAALTLAALAVASLRAWRASTARLESAPVRPRA